MRAERSDPASVVLRHIRVNGPRGVAVRLLEHTGAGPHRNPAASAAMTIEGSSRQPGCVCSIHERGPGDRTCRDPPCLQRRRRRRAGAPRAVGRRSHAPRARGRLRLRWRHDGARDRPPDGRHPQPARPAQRPRARRPERDEGRDRGDHGPVRPDLHGRRLRRAEGRRSHGRARAERRGRGVRVALHARWPPDRRATPQAAHEPDGRPHPALVRRRPDPRPDQQLQALFAALPRHRHHREHRRLRARPRAHGEGDAGGSARRRGPDDVA